MVLDEHKHNFDIHINHIEHEDVCGDSLRIQHVILSQTAFSGCRPRILMRLLRKKWSTAFTTEV